ncbi:N-acetylmuramoyl-L-alanine amidase [Paenibacillus profundus]|uniref:N-acetylmuramoyl-L-alanine amidase n=1 Tax=Paenibacillus profundus TaxID=1173085 RepID=A0ABS8Y9S4_9BACL|nr:N-acetylmuramoyl-L-alanine amidase [Paenibacillus profundus]MCE5167879.1 N-acetylmuramoyl-L-alanine amidase [Paenibacillus profundus]
MAVDVVWKGNEYTNSSDRKGQAPLIIVNHISAGSMSSMDSWFTSPDNKVSSAHFGVSKQGTIHQYVKLERMAWAQGITADRIATAPAAIVRSKGINPNLYAVSIEHEGLDGELTEQQFVASVALHRYIQAYVADHWGYTIPFDREHVLGHFQIDPVRKASCPGAKFPWKQLYSTLSLPDKRHGGADSVEEQLKQLQTLVTDLKGRLAWLESQHQLQEVPIWAKASVDKAVAQGLVYTPTPSSLDFYRMLIVLDRKGLL